MIGLALAAWIVLFPPPQPDPSPGGGGLVELPTYMVNGDGTRMLCSPTADQCWRDTSGLPSYLTP